MSVLHAPLRYFYMLFIYLKINDNEKQNINSTYKKQKIYLFQHLLITSREMGLLFQKQYSSFQLLLKLIGSILLLQFTEVYIISTIKIHTETWQKVKLATLYFGTIRKKNKKRTEWEIEISLF